MDYKDTQYKRKMKISIDYNNMMDDILGSEYGINIEEINQLLPLAGKIVNEYIDFNNNSKIELLNKNMVSWLKSPDMSDDDFCIIEKIANDIKDNFDNFVVLGIGGSALGPIAVHQAINHFYYNDLPSEKRNAPKFYVVDNVDPVRLSQLLDIIDVEKTCFNVISKSGNTSETMSQYMWIYNELSNKIGDKWTDNVVLTTDEHKGNLIKFSIKYNIKTLYIPDGVGGRFSEMSPVGLLSAAVCNIDIRAMLAGAAYMRDYCTEQSVMENPAMMLAILDYIAIEKGIDVQVLMPYVDSLKFISDWYAQLSAESLGKVRIRDGKNVGMTPVKALGVTDQHSQVQLYTQGQFDKVLTFIGVKNYDTVLEIPKVFEDSNIAFLGGHTFNELIKAEQAATEYALTKAGRLNRTITLPEVNEFTLGQLLFLFEMHIAYLGSLMGVDAFDQPGVEEGKVATYALLGRDGFDEKKQELESRPVLKPEYII